MDKKQEYQLISEIADRAIKLMPNIKKFDMVMDLDYTHREIPMDLEKLLKFKHSDFMHDIGGILINFNRIDKKMHNCFVPRCAK